MSKSRAGPKAWILASTLFINMDLLSTSMGEESKDARDLPGFPSQREPGELSLEERIKRLEMRNEELRAILNADLPANVPPDPSTTDGRVDSPPLDLRGRLFPQRAKDPAEYNLQSYWNNGLEIRSSDQGFVMNLGGRIDFDNSWYQLPSLMQPTLTNPLLDGSELRRARLRAGGTAYTQFEYLFEVDLSSGSDFFTLTPNPAQPLYLTDAWIAMNQLPALGSVKIGHQRELLTFSNSMSGNFLPFMERPYIFDAFNDFFQYSTGVSVTRNFYDDHFQAWAGFFRTGTRTGAYGIGDGDGAFSARLNCQPILMQEDQTWVTLSAAGSVRTIPQDPGYMYYFARPLVRAGSAYQVPFLINTPQLYSEDLVNYLNFNAHAAWKRFTIGGEYLASWVNNVSNGGMPTPGAPQPASLTPLGNVYLDGYYLELLCFLTPGDFHPLDTKTMSLDRVMPQSPFICRDKSDPNQPNGWGAWEIGLRLDNLNFNSGVLQAGSLNSLSTGINWYWNPNMRLMGNYIYTFREVDVPNGTGNIHAFGLRAHVDF